MVQCATAFSLSHELIQRIESDRGEESRSGFVETILRKHFGMPEKNEESRSPSTKTETGSITYQHDDEG